MWHMEPALERRFPQLGAPGAGSGGWWGCWGSAFLRGGGPGISKNPTLGGPSPPGLVGLNGPMAKWNGRGAKAEPPEGEARGRSFRIRNRARVGPVAMEPRPRRQVHRNHRSPGRYAPVSVSSPFWEFTGTCWVCRDTPLGLQGPPVVRSPTLVHGGQI